MMTITPMTSEILRLMSAPPLYCVVERAGAAALAPLPAIAFVLWLRTRKTKYLALFAIAISIVFFVHGHIATPLALAFFIGAWLFDFVGKHQKRNKGQPEKLKPPYGGWRGIFIALLIFVGLTAIWWLPYFIETPLIGSPQIRAAINTPDLLIHLVTRGAKGTTQVRYLGMVALLIAVLGLASKKAPFSGSVCRYGFGWIIYVRRTRMELVQQDTRLKISLFRTSGSCCSHSYGRFGDFGNSGPYRTAGTII